MKARFVRIHWENSAQTIGTVYCTPDKPYYFTAGQYADFSVPHDNPDRRGLTRTMTIVTRPSEKLIGFTTRFGKNISTYKKALLNLQPGDILNLTDPMGDLVLPLTSTIPLVFVAGGVAVASYISMIRWLTEQNDSRSITVLYAVRSRNDVIFQNDFQAYQDIGTLRQILFTTDPLVTEQEWKNPIESRRITAQDIMRYSSMDAQIYLSGAENMVEQLRHSLENEFKVDQYRIAFDFYEGYTEL